MASEFGFNVIPAGEWPSIPLLTLYTVQYSRVASKFVCGTR